MRLLILGGGVFLGRALTDAALDAGHIVTHFNRGKSSAPDTRVDTITGDRTDPASLELAKGENRWDAVIDTSGYLPQVVRRSVEALIDSTHRYLFVSSVSVYRGQGYGEEAAVFPAPIPLPDAMTPENYGPLKAACEVVVRDAFGERAIIVRPGLIVGPHDPTDRFTWWPARVARGGRVAAPGRPARKVQFIDVRDLAEWMIALLEDDARGTFNATGPARPVTMLQFLERCRAVAGGNAKLEWIDEAFLAQQKVAPWKEMPLWVPETDAVLAGLMNVPIQRALATGLAFRPLQQTIEDTLEWSASRAPDHEWKAGLPPEREKQLLAALDAGRTNAD
jgi:nucleoside-diphosphate-sugar epimerase